MNFQINGVSLIMDIKMIQNKLGILLYLALFKRTDITEAI